MIPAYSTSSDYHEKITHGTNFLLYYRIYQPSCAISSSEFPHGFQVPALILTHIDLLFPWFAIGGGIALGAMVALAAVTLLLISAPLAPLAPLAVVPPGTVVACVGLITF